MTVSQFIEKYKRALFLRIIADPSFDVSIRVGSKDLKFQRNKVYLPDSTTKYRVSLNDIEKFTSEQHDDRRISTFLSEDVLWQPRDVQCLMDMAKDKSVRKYAMENLSRAKGVLWTVELIEDYKEFWSWYRLSSNPSVPWDDKMIEHFSDLVDFKELSYNGNLNISNPDTIEKYEMRWDWNAISGNPSIFKSLSSLIYSHDKVVWKNEPLAYYDLGANFEDLNSVYFSGSPGSRSVSVYPCVSTNPAIRWTASTYALYGKKIDLWLTLQFASFTNELILSLGDLINENRVFSVASTRFSDWTDSHPIYRNGWENFLRNYNTVVDEDLLYHLSHQDVTRIGFGGNAMRGHHQMEFSVKANSLVRSSSLKLTIDELAFCIRLIPEKFINECSIDIRLFNSIIKPDLLSHPEKLEQLIRSIERFDKWTISND